MFWQEKETTDVYRVPTDVVDVCFKVRCSRLPVDHAYALCTSISERLPWIGREFGTGIHLMHGAESGNGWFRPPSGDYLELSRRSRLRIRVSRDRRQDVAALTGERLRVADCIIEVGEATEKLLTPTAVVFSRYVAMTGDEAEDAFMHRCAEELGSLGIRARKMLCGKPLSFSMPDGDLATRSLMIADLDPEQSVVLQQAGIGGSREFGMGLVHPHKGIEAVYRDRDA